MLLLLAKGIGTAAVAVTALAILSASVAHAQAQLIFTGGNNTPLTISLVAPVTYTVTTLTANTTIGRPLFVFDELGAFGFHSFTGTWTYSVNGNAPLTLTNVGSNFLSGSLTSDDVFLYGTLTNLAVGDKVTLNAATVTTNSNVFAAPASGSYNTFLVRDTFANETEPTAISGSGVSAAVVPEASGAALLGLTLPLIGVVAVARRKK